MEFKKKSDKHEPVKLTGRFKKESNRTLRNKNIIVDIKT